jgi:O-antigen ligase
MPLAPALVFFATWLAVLSGGAIEPLPKAIVLALIGLAFLVAPPKSGLGPAVWIPALFLALWPATAFLPKSWSGSPVWRTALEQDYGLDLGPFLSPQPFATLESWITLLVALSWVYYLCCYPWTDRQRWALVQLTSLATAATAALALVHQQASLPSIPWWEYDLIAAHFGPFPNPNHFGTLLAMGAVAAAAAAFDLQRRRRIAWLLHAAALPLILFTSLASGSRAAVLLSFAGLGIWMVAVALQIRSITRLAIAASILLLFLSLFLAFGNQILTRAGGPEDAMAAITTDGRVDIYLDSAIVIQNHPVFGTGLGNFEPVFAMLQDHSARLERNINPESDWLWGAIELGPVAALAIFAAMVPLLGRMDLTNLRNNKSRRRNRRLRLAAATAAMLFIIHATFDSPAHVLAPFLLASLMLGLALSQRFTRPAPSPWLPLTFRLAGLATITLAYASFSASKGHPILPGPTAAGIIYAKAKDLAASASAQPPSRDGLAASARLRAEALDLAHQALRLTPLDWRLHQFVAHQSLLDGQRHNVAATSFRIARRLEPHSAYVPFHEGRLWLSFDPGRALAPWREVLRRDRGRRTEYYENMLSAASQLPELREGIRSLSIGDSQLRALMLLSSSEEEFPEDLATLLSEDPELRQLDDTQKLALFQLWRSRGDAKDLIERIRQRASWLHVGWPLVAQAEANEGRFEHAYQIASNQLERPLLPSVSALSPQEALRNHRLNPTDLSRALTLYALQKSSGDWEAAAKTLDTIEQLPNAPDWLDIERAALAAAQRDFRKAWELVASYLNL